MISVTSQVGVNDVYPHVKRSTNVCDHWGGDGSSSSDYKPDFICFDEVVVELKALGRLTSVEESQVINYLKVGGFEIGLLINFGARSLEQRRFVLTKTSYPQIAPITPI
ncbi:MAG TPA: GxxExxY protein [Pyrinomonadaceae bacterium]|nr:GxxExxY protein [Pyrinomonadaceae bacterium]